MASSSAQPETTTDDSAPTNGEADDTCEEIERVFKKQRRSFRETASPSRSERADRLRRLRDLLVKRRSDVQAALYADFRKAPEEVDMTEIKSVTGEIDHALRHLKSWMRPDETSAPTVLAGTTSEVYYEPKGVVLIISPWNYPVSLTFGPLVSALAAGNCVVLKPSEYTSNTAGLMREMIQELYEEQEVALFEGDEAVAQALLKQPFDHIFFTGSSRVGRIVMKAAADHLASVTLELGGKSPAIVDETADVEDAARKIVWGKFVNAGQTCIAPDYCLVHESQEAALVYAMRRQLRAFYGETEEERKDSPDYARLIGSGHFECLQELLEKAVEAGAYVSEGGPGDAGDRYFPPTILTDVPLDARVMHEEIFGPILPVLPFEALNGAVDIVNDRPNPLSLYLFSKSHNNTDYVLNRTTAGSTCINDALLHYLNPNLPFGGTGHSGIGKSHGEYGFKAFSNERAVLRRTYGSKAMEWIYPPYGDVARRLVDGVMKWL